jgi:hypothetical protein
MSEAKHTPGPWVVSGFSIHTKSGRPIVNSLWHPPQPPKGAGEELQVESDANARLIAAAPHLLAILRSFLMQTLQGPVLERDSIISEARAAIAQAEGRS